jgi:hypothetical protein
MQRAERRSMRARFIVAIVAIVALVALGGGGCVLPVGVLAGFQPYYSHGDFEKAYADKTHALATVGCVDVAPSLREAAGALVLDFRMGNRCGDAVVVDLTQLRLYAVSVGGERAPRSLVDPNEEIRPLPLPGRGQAFEPIAVREPGSPEQLCIDVSAIAPPTRATLPQLCFTKRGERWVAVSGGAS